MDTTVIRDLVCVQGACLVLLLLAFLAWFRLRESRTGDLVCAGVSTAAVLALAGAQFALGKLAPLGILFGLPGVIVYLWFLSLRSSRREQSRIRQWGRVRGYRITTIDRVPTLGRSSLACYHLVARRLSDGRILRGQATFQGSALQMTWEDPQ